MVESPILCQNRGVRVLIIGGTKFLGCHLSEAALAKGHELTLFNRGQTNPDLFPDAEHVQGDRLDGFGALKGRNFDAVIDTCGFFPRAVQISAKAFEDRADRYVFISSISVFDQVAVSGLKEDGHVGTIDDEANEEITDDTYGPLKALCENVVSDVFGSQALNIRPGLIVGPNDPTDRYTYWPVRFARSGEVLAPDRKAQPTQFIDVRDLAEWIVLLLEQKSGGTFNATGPEQPLTLGETLERIRVAINTEAQIAWVDTKFLEEQNVEPWSDLPFVVPYDGSADGMESVDVSKAVGTGLRFRPLEETAWDTLVWVKSEGLTELRAGLKPEREREILEAYRLWHKG